MAIDNFIPEVWSARLLENLFETHIYGSAGVINRDYEGDISEFGDSVRISNIGDVTVSTYTKNTDIAAPETLTDATRTLDIDQSKYYNFQIDDVDKAQQKPKVMDAAMKQAAYALSKVADQFIAAQYVDVDAGNVIPAATPTTSNAYEYLVDLGVLLDEDNTPEDGRWVIVPPWYEGLLLKDDRFVSFATPEAKAARDNRAIGSISGFTVYKSNNVPIVATEYQVMAGHPIAWSFAEQITETEAYRPEKRFGDAVKGLHLYGSKVVRPENLALFEATKP